MDRWVGAVTALSQVRPSESASLLNSPIFNETLNLKSMQTMLASNQGQIQGQVYAGWGFSMLMIILMLVGSIVVSVVIKRKLSHVKSKISKFLPPLTSSARVEMTPMLPLEPRQAITHPETKVAIP